MNEREIVSDYDYMNNRSFACDNYDKIVVPFLF